MILDGKSLSNKLFDELKEKTNKLDKKPTLCVIKVKGDTASDVYVKQKEIRGNYLGFNFVLKEFNKDTHEEELINLIKELNKDVNINGIIVQIPLPNHINSNKVINYINEEKDVDGLTDINIGKLIHNKKCLMPCTPSGIIEILNNYNINVSGKTVCVIGRSNLVGKPISMMLTNMDATVINCNSKTTDLKNFTTISDILIVACGHKHLITRDMVKENSIIIDVGITRENNKLYGDVDFNNIQDKAKYITPVPGGVGPMTVYELYNNTYNAYLNQKN